MIAKLIVVMKYVFTMQRRCYAIQNVVFIVTAQLIYNLTNKYIIMQKYCLFVFVITVL